MAINFTTNLEQYTTTNATQRTSNYYNYTSKKQLQNANVLSMDALNFVLSIKNTFAFAVHKNLQYVAVTLYYASTKKYGFIVLDLHNKAVAEVTSIKQAKQEIDALVNVQE
jgi:hypothetical protein